MPFLRRKRVQCPRTIGSLPRAARRESSNSRSLSNMQCESVAVQGILPAEGFATGSSEELSRDPAQRIQSGTRDQPPRGRIISSVFTTSFTKNAFKIGWPSVQLVQSVARIGSTEEFLLSYI
uniref:(northern house mosquito) hypothetical protein n=1 Tax=Culex pipiens TaxID=7175 RepID=A0A8D8GYF8_CULPI